MASIVKLTALPSDINLEIHVSTNRQQEKASAHTRTRKLTEKQQQQKHKWKRAKYNHVQENSIKTVKQIPSGI
jgi:hypothetical protein